VEKAVEKINALLGKLDAEDSDVPALRTEILSLILECLSTRESMFEDWEKTHFSNAIGALGLNIHSLPQPTVAWLRLALIDLQRAMASAPERDPNFRSPDPSLRDVTYPQLRGALEALRREIL
jgi:hypothetical protein